MPRRVLLIDDDRLQHRIAQGHFSGFPGGTYVLEGATTYEEGLGKLLSNEYAVCLLDYQLGERDGLQLIREAVAKGCRTPIVFLTAETADRVDVEAMNAGALDYLVKGEITARMLERSLRYAVKLGETVEALRLLATHDELTGLLNRREFDRIANEEVQRAARFGHGLALAIVDVDHFKRINDTHGHGAGDVVLHEIAKRLSATVRGVDRVARLGGEEFGLILIESDSGGAMQVAERICAVMRNEPVRVNATLNLPVTVSVGVATFLQHAADPATLITAADKALYAAKSAGRDRAVLASRVA